MISNANKLLKGEINSIECVDQIFFVLENEILDKREISLDFSRVAFISVYFLEKFENLFQTARNLDVKLQIINVSPSIQKVFHVARLKDIIQCCS